MFVFQDIPHSVLSRKRVALASLSCAIGASIALLVDNRWSTGARGWDLPGDLRKGIELSEVFGHSLGAAGILLTVFWVATDKRRVVWWAIYLTALSGLTANLLKGSVTRIRPHSVESLRAEQPSHAIDSAPAKQENEANQAVRGEAGGGEESSPPAQPLRFWDSRQRSFPSGHAATAWGLAMGLSFISPRGTLLFAFFATMASLQRVYSGAHFVSDVLAGAAIAFAWTWLLLSIRKTQGLLTSDNHTTKGDLR